MTLYTTHCPRCRVLEAALASKDMSYDVCEDIEKMKELRIDAAPALEVDGKIFSYMQAMDYVMSQPAAAVFCDSCSI